MSFRTQAITAVLSYLHVSGDDILGEQVSMMVPIVVVDAAGGLYVPYHSDRQLPQILVLTVGQISAPIGAEIDFGPSRLFCPNFFGPDRG
jgi:hypothetical protein